MLSDEETISLNRMKLFARRSDLSVVTAKDMDIVVTLIEKQQKEIERLNNKFEKIYNEIDNKNSQLVKALNYKLFIEDKIKAKIEEVKDGTYDAKIVLQSLLEKE